LLRASLIGLTVACVPALAWAADLHADPVAGVALALTVILSVGKLGGELAVRLGQAAVVGELIVGVLLGNLDLVGIRGLEFIVTDASIDMLARLGVLLLLFEVGVEATVGQMSRVGVPALMVAVLGVLTPLLLGWGAAALLLPNGSPYQAVFIGSILTATSVGITARVLKDLNRSGQDEARIILGAAVIDDVLGLFLMAVVAGVIVAADGGEPLSYVAIGLTLAKATGFLAVSIALGVYLTPRLFHAAIALRADAVLLTLGLVLCFAMAWAADAVGLAPIIGAFTAGLVLEGLHSGPYVARGERSLSDLLHPLTSFLAPVFFVVMGMRTDLQTFTQGSTLALATVLVLVAVASKLASGLGVAGRGLNGLAIGIGMIPRGEVGLIFANMGLALSVGGVPILAKSAFSAVVVTVILTTLVTPPALTWALKRRHQKRSHVECP
jgi:Kef-type K+ transport system membrane component KefB